MLIVYTLSLVLIYSQGLASIKDIQEKQETELKYFRFAWLSEHACNKSTLADFVTIDCKAGARAKFNSSAKFDAMNESLVQSLTHVRGNHSILASSFSQPQWNRNLRVIMYIYSYIEGPWILLWVFPLLSLATFLFPLYLWNGVLEERNIRSMKLKESRRSIDDVTEDFQSKNFTSNTFSERSPFFYEQNYSNTTTSSVSTAESSNKAFAPLHTRRGFQVSSSV